MNRNGLKSLTLSTCLHPCNYVSHKTHNRVCETRSSESSQQEHTVIGLILKNIFWFYLFEHEHMAQAYM